MEIIIYHGSEEIIEKPEFGKGSLNNDYGRGFYCTQSIELSKEWACKNNRDGYSNVYKIDASDLKICNLNSSDYNILNWLALLTKHRGYWQRNSIAEDAKEYLQEHFYVDISEYDVVIGNRADDSYFSFAQDFIMGTISLQKLSRAMNLGMFGEQIMIKSKKAFSKLCYIGNEVASASQYFYQKKERDMIARRDYANTKSANLTEEIYIIDLLRGRVKADEIGI